ncbi:MAG: protein kinase [Pyrinomonadaceae bacterium]|nr:protein kinase [Pyrinomonadaceae bacterium]
MLDWHLPVFEKDSIWRYSRLRTANDPEQGWKLHVSATILTAATVLEAVAPFLKSRAAFYKVPVSLHELKKLNAGIFYDYTQIGKFITIYPQTDEESVYFAEHLHQLTFKIASPAIPFEARLKPESCVFYRYGAFKINELKIADDTVVLAMRDEKGDLIPDVRETDAPPPAWAANPFPVEKKVAAADDSPLKKHFRIIRALSQRGKGGVYQALDLRGANPRSCLLKEGRKNGETEWDGRDGFWRVRHERDVLKILQSANTGVPQIYSSFEAENNFYLATEFIEGVNLHLFLKKRKRRLEISRAIKFAVQLSEIISRIHAAGWLWRDCKPANLIVTEAGELRPLDFEGACLIDRPDPTAWTTLTFNAENRDGEFLWQSSEAVDLYALGAIIFLLFEGELPVVTENEVPVISRKNVPAEIKRFVSDLLNPLNAKNLKAVEVERKLRKIQK